MAQARRGVRSREVKNRTARREFATSDSVTAGLVLTGPQIKAVRAGKIDLTGTYVKILENRQGRLEAWANGITIGNDSQTVFKLLLTKDQISHFVGLAQKKQATLVVTRGHFLHGYFKVDVAPGRRLKLHDRRDQLRAADLQREAERGLR